MSHHLPRLQVPALYFGSLTMPSGAAVLLEMIASVSVTGRKFRPSQHKLADMRHCSRRTIIRQLKLLSERGYVRVIRRGRRLTNVYRLSRSLWGRLTGKVARFARHSIQGELASLGLRVGGGPGDNRPTGGWRESWARHAERKAAALAAFKAHVATA